VQTRYESGSKAIR